MVLGISQTLMVSQVRRYRRTLCAPLHLGRLAASAWRRVNIPKMVGKPWENHVKSMVSIGKLWNIPVVSGK